MAEYIRALRSDDPKDDDANAGELEAAYDAWLTSHPSPAPVAAPCAGNCADCNLSPRPGKPAPSAEPEDGADPGPYFCICCELVDVTQCDADRCCLGCGYDLWPLSQVRELLSRAGLAIVKASDVPRSETWQDKHMKLAAQMQQLAETVASMPCAECARRAAKEGKTDG